MRFSVSPPPRKSTFEGGSDPGRFEPDSAYSDDEGPELGAGLAANGEGTVSSRRTDTEVRPRVEHSGQLSTSRSPPRRSWPRCQDGRLNETIVLHERPTTVGVHARGRVEQGLQFEQGTNYRRSPGLPRKTRNEVPHHDWRRRAKETNHWTPFQPDVTAASERGKRAAAAGCSVTMSKLP